MSNTASRRSTMTLFSHSNNIYSHQVRIVLAEKGVQYDLVEVEPNKECIELLDYNPYGVLPTLVDRELVLYNSAIILEYLDERFPHPPLMDVFPVQRAHTRLFLYRIVKDWYSQVEAIIANPGDMRLKKELADTLLSNTEAVSSFQYFLSDEFSLFDCYVAPMLWRLPELGVVLEGNVAKDWKRYQNLVFERSSFRESLTNDEINQRNIALEGLAK